MSTEHLNQAAIGGGIAVCGMAPAKRLATIDPTPCVNCQGARVLRLFSGSAWYPDHMWCLDCGENIGTRHRPFERAWRKKNIALAEQHITDIVPLEEYHELTSAARRTELSWLDEREPESEGATA